MFKISDIPEKISNLITAKLVEFEDKFDVTIFHVILSGSRMWGYHTEKSDYDVKFLYYRKADAYLSLREKKSDLGIREMDRESNLDFQGMDIKKFFSLLSNGTYFCYEMVNSPLVLKNGFSVEDKEFITSQCHPKQLAFQSSGMLHAIIRDSESKKCEFTDKELLVGMRESLLLDCYTGTLLIPEYHLPKLDIDWLRHSYLGSSTTGFAFLDLIIHRRNNSISQPRLQYCRDNLISHIYSTYQDIDQRINKMSNPLKDNFKEIDQYYIDFMRDRVFNVETNL